MKRLGLALAFWLSFAAGAPAQQAKVVTTCGSLPTPYTAGQLAYWTVDLNGKLCARSAGAVGFLAPSSPAEPVGEPQP